MKKLFALVLAMMLMLSAAALAAPTEDRAGNPIELKDDMQKLVSLAPSTTRVLLDMGLGDKLVAIDTYSAMYAPELSELPQFDMMTPDVEQLAALEPDAVFITGMSTVDGDSPFQALMGLGIQVVIIPSSSSIAAIQEDIRFIGACVGDEEGAQALVDDMQAQIDAVAAIGETIEDKKTVAIEVAALPYLCYAGGETYLNEMIELIGAVNAYGDQPAWASVTEEAAVAVNPDVILTAIDYLPDPVDEIVNREGWGEVKAIADGQVYQLDSESANQPNHNIVKALWQMAEAVYPEAFAAADEAA
ncbi:MAG: ABC transporter substrate-binding protein [Clostridia bacterium]|nr:ABC transporter substrate-binding protein [Clostridia bacterium]